MYEVASQVCFTCKKPTPHEFSEHWTRCIICGNSKADLPPMPKKPRKKSRS